MGKLVRAIVVGALATGVAGCWPVPGHDADRTAHNDVEAAITTSTVVELEEAWAWAASGPVAVRGPVTSAGGVHVAVGCDLVTVDAGTGALRWSARVTDPSSLPCDGVFRQVAAEPFVAGDRVHVGGESVFSGGPQPTRPPSYAASTAAFAIRTGEPAGRVAIGRLDALRGDVAAGSDGYVTGTYPDHRIVQHGVIARLDGTQRRVLPTGALVGRATLGTDTLYVSGDAVTAYPVSGPQGGCGPDGTTECPLWSTPLDGAAGGPPVLGDGGATLYVGTAAGTVYALDTATGAVSWTAAVGSPVTGAPALAGGALFVPTGSGDLVALDAGCATATCTPLWSAPTGSTITWQPTVAGGVAFTASGDGALRAFDAAGCGEATCPALWSAPTGSTVTGAPAVSGGRLYAGTADGRLVAYGLP